MQIRLAFLPTEAADQLFVPLHPELRRLAAAKMKRALSSRTTKIDIAQFVGIANETGTATLQEMDDVLDKLGAIEPRLRIIVEMKVFEGLSLEAIAERLNISSRAVAREWTFSKRWLREKLQATRTAVGRRDGRFRGPLSL